MRRPKILLAGILPTALLALVAVPGAPLPAADDPPPRGDLKQEWQAARAAATLAPKEVAKRAIVKRGDVPHVVLNMEFETEAARAAACKEYAAAKNPALHVVTEFNRFAITLVPAPDDDENKQLNAGLDAVEKPDGLVWYEIVGEVEPPPPVPGVNVKPMGLAVPEPIVRGGFKTADGKHLTGKGVIVAIIDTGVDFRHPDFVRTTADGKKESRFVAIWDTHREYQQGKPGKPGPILYPGGVPVGTVFSREELTADLDKKDLGNFDVDSHGTSCAGIAAGSGAALEAAKGQPNADAALKQMDYRGVAPEADLIAVRIGNVPNGNLANAWVLNVACDWIDQEASKRKQPAVISCSFGSETGGRDGFRVAERWLTERLPETTPGRLVFFAAGNEGSDGPHGSAPCPAGESGRLTWDLEPGAKAFIEVYVDGTDGARVDKARVTVKLGPDTEAKVGKPYVNALSGSVVYPVSATSGGSLSVTAPNGAVADAYMRVGSGKKGPLGKFTGTCLKNANQLISPATAASGFAVGSYDFNHLFLLPDGMFETKGMVIGKLSAYSNAGYLRGRKDVKPEFAAPGQWHLAACPDPVPEHVREYKLLAMTEKYQRFNGTSAATPYAAGVAALLLEKNPNLTAKQLRELLPKVATKDKFTEAVPNPMYGHGKLDLAAVGRLVTGVGK